MGLDFVGNPNKIEYVDIDEIVMDDSSEDENAQALENWELYESSEYDEAEVYESSEFEEPEVYESSEYDEAEVHSYIYFFSDSDTSNASEEPIENISTNTSESKEEEKAEDLQQKGSNIANSTKNVDLKVSEEVADLNTNEVDTNT